MRASRGVGLLPGALEGWTIYGPNTTDYPGRYVVRRWQVSEGRTLIDVVPTAVVDTLEAARAVVPLDTVCMSERVPGNDPVLLETWI